MYIEAIISCVNYSDFLGAVLHHNLNHFDHVVVVTDYEDRETQGLCKHLSVECRTTDVHRTRGETFSKGRMVDYGMSYLLRKEWVVHMDADIFLPTNTRRTLESLILDEDCIYGIDRVNCPNYEAWEAYTRGHMHQNRQHWMLVPPPFPMGARVVRSEHGYVPIGFFQMWHGKHQRRYPIRQPSAEHTDFLHSLQWPSHQRRLMPEIIAIHLESEPAKMGANWCGRKTKHFGPCRKPHHPNPRPYCKD